MPLFDRPPIDAILASNSSFSSGTFRITGGPGVTVGSDASGASVSGQALSLGASNSTWTSGSFRLTGGVGVTVQSDASGALISAGDGARLWRNFPEGLMSTITAVSAVSKTPFYWAEQLPGHVTLNTVAFKISVSQTTTSAQSLSQTIHFGVYGRVNSTSASLKGSVSEAFIGSSASSASWANAIRHFILTSPSTHVGISTLEAGDWVFGMMVSAAAAVSQSIFGVPPEGASGAVGNIRPGNVYSTGTSQGLPSLVGRGSTTVNALPANIVASEIVNQGSGVSNPIHPWILFRA